MNRFAVRTLVMSAVMAAAFVVPGVVRPLGAQDAPKPAVVRQTGTVKSVENGTLTMTNAAGATLTITLGTPSRVVQLPPSMDVKAATPTTLDQVAAGDRVLIAGKAGASATAIVATQVVVMKAADIAARNAAIQADWQKRGTGGIVTAVDAATGALTIKSGSKSETVQTSPTTVYRRYAPGSVKYEEAVPGTLAQIQAGDQLQVRGDKSADGATVTAEEIVSGAFRNISGLIASMDAAAQTITVKDLATKKVVTVAITPETDLHVLPQEMAARMAARLKRAKSGGAAAGGKRPEGAPGQGAQGGSEHGGPGGPGGSQRGGGEPSLARMLPMMPKGTLAELKQGEALMIVASEGDAAKPLSAITVLAGVEALLQAAPSGSEGMTLSPWSLNSGSVGGDAGGMQQ